MTRRITSTGCRGRGLAKQNEGSAGRKGPNVDGAAVVIVVKVKSAKFRNELWPSGRARLDSSAEFILCLYIWLLAEGGGKSLWSWR